jgi:hypothetical protein
MDEVQVAYIGSGGGGSGTLYYQVRTYPFAVGGLGIGASTISAEGEVYKLNNVAMLPGAYGQARYGLALGNASMGDLWLQNEAGVILHHSVQVAWCRSGTELAAGAGGADLSVMRLYWPKETAPSILPPGRGTWQPPAVLVAA